MTFSDTMGAIALERRVVEEMRRRLPPGVSGRAVDRELRDAAWRCIVAGLAPLDADSRVQVTPDAKPEPELLVVRAARPVTPAPRPEPAAPVAFTIRRRGEVCRAS